MKIPAEFQPQSWEMPPGARLIEATASVVAREFDGETLDWLVALVKIPALEHPITWVRPLDARFDAGFVVLGLHNKSPFLITRHHPLNAPDALLSVMSQHHRLGRCLFFNQEGNLRQKGEEALGAVVFSSDGMASWLADSIADDVKTAIPFRWNKVLTVDKFLHLSALEIWNRLQQLLDKPNRKISFARQFAFADEQTRQNLIFDSVPIDVEECNALVHSLILSQDFWSEAEAEAEFRIRTDETPVVSIHLKEELSKTPLSLKQDVDLLWQHYQPVKAEVAKYLCVLNWLKERSGNIGGFFFPPTAHEQLEAKLRWREWKENHEKL